MTPKSLFESAQTYGPVTIRPGRIVVSSDCPDSLCEEIRKHGLAVQALIEEWNCVSNGSVVRMAEKILTDCHPSDQKSASASDARKSREPRPQDMPFLPGLVP
jgi:hypothetical protein